MKMRWWFPALVLALGVTGCKSAHIDALVENHTGQAVTLVEVDYPSASFGIDSLAAGANYPYRIQVRLSGNMTVEYTESQSLKIRKVTGPELKEGEQGHITIVLLPDGKVQFEPVLHELQ
jgi:hypothetical protein